MRPNHPLSLHLEDFLNSTTESLLAACKIKQVQADMELMLHGIKVKIWRGEKALACFYDSCDGDKNSIPGISLVSALHYVERLASV